MMATMRAIQAWRAAEDAGRSGCGKLKSAPRDAGGWLGLAATPAFATMALLTAAPGADAQYMVCAAQGSALLSGMSAMYILMAAFHSAPWLKLIFWRRPPPCADESSFCERGL